MSTSLAEYLEIRKRAAPLVDAVDAGDSSAESPLEELQTQLDRLWDRLTEEERNWLRKTPA